MKEKPLIPSNEIVKYKWNNYEGAVIKSSPIFLPLKKKTMNVTKE